MKYQGMYTCPGCGDKIVGNPVMRGDEKEVGPVLSAIGLLPETCPNCKFKRSVDEEITLVLALKGVDLSGYDMAVTHTTQAAA